MEKVECKECDCEIFAKYSPLSGKTDKDFAVLQQKPSEDITLEVYLTCDNNHTNKYYTKII